MQNPASIETAIVHPVTYRWTSGCQSTNEARCNLSVMCSQKNFRRRRLSWDEAAARGAIDNVCDIPRRPSTTKACSSAASPARVRFIYEDEDAKARVCGNVQQILNVVQEDPQAISANAQVARKVLKYRRIMERLDNVNVEDPDFDVSAFFGIEWCHVDTPSS
ncbi:unnamed protein product [Peronospora belbahrii]|uniref:Uncharacterized protein n=1 Tax=Peronospora belbahrii TaxID=622444 RepID=A0AAU9LIM5_9STRA|nr:unnamed protein product [Peronospora belbahrii]CAH0521106.1 unnamed protein product [Peronospora belbahrii]